MTREPSKIIHLDELEAVPGPGSLTWRPVRLTLGIRAFGCNAYTAGEPGQLRPSATTLARDDEDLESLRDDPEFAAQVGR